MTDPIVPTDGSGSLGERRRVHDGGIGDVLAETVLAEADERARRVRIEAVADAFRHVADILGMDALAHVVSQPDPALRIDGLIARIDGAVSTQLNRILHAPPFQALEASWRGLHALVERHSEIDEGNDVEIRIRVLTISLNEIERDLERAVEFDQSQLFSKIYSEEFGTPGGRPFGVILADYELHAGLSSSHPTDDIGIAQRLAEIGAAALAPVVAAAHPSFFECSSFADIVRLRDLEGVIKAAPWHGRWAAIRQAEDSRFLALCLPRVLVRLPYAADGTGAWGFRFEEEMVERAQVSDRAGEATYRDVHAFGTAVYAYGAVLMRAFAETGWFADIRGTRVDLDGGGVVPGGVIPSFATDAPGVAPKFGIDAFLTPSVESELSELGFLPLNRCWLTNTLAFHGSQSVQDPAVYDSEVPTANARLMALLQYVLCASRFGHYIKVMVRDHVGAFTSAADCERYLRTWLNQYTANIDNLPEESRAKSPLRESGVEVRDDPGTPGRYHAIVRLRPHYQADELVSTLKLVTELTPSSS